MQDGFESKARTKTVMKMDKKNEKSYLYADNIQFTVHNQEMKRENI